MRLNYVGIFIDKGKNIKTVFRMKKMMFTLLVILAGVVLKAQDYKYAGGVRFGLPFGLTGKIYMDESTRFEGIFSPSWGGVGLTALYEISSPTDAYPNLRWYYGGGFHVGVGDGGAFSPWSYGNANGVLGIDGIIGLEYRFEGHPLEVSFDWIPSINLIGHFGFGHFQLGLSGRYLF